MKYLSYKDIPIYADYTTDGSYKSPISSLAQEYLRLKANDYLLMASEASVSIETNLTPNRYIGSSVVKNDYSLSGPQTAKISMTFIPIIGATDAASFLFNTKSFFDNATGNGYLEPSTYAQGQYGTTLRMSNFVFKKSFLQSYSIKINPHQPVVVSANYISYDLDSITGSSLVPYTNVSPQLVTPKISNSAPVYSVMHALTTKVEPKQSSTYLPYSNLNIEINVDCQRTPIFTVGSRLPNRVIVTAIERTTTIQGENINNVINLFGQTAAFDISFAPLSSYGNENSSNYQHTINISGLITSQQLSVAQNSMLNGKVVIKELIL